MTGRLTRLATCRAVWINLALCGALAAAMPLALVSGAADYPLATLWRAARGDLGQHQALWVLWELRMPRILLGVMVGLHLAVSAAVLQATLRNPLAEPAVLGVSSGATLGVMLLLLVANFSGSPDPSRLDAYDPTYMLPAAQCGGIGAAFMVYALAWRGGVAPFRLILMGVAVSAALYAIAMTILVGWGSSRIEVVLTWLSGSLYGRGWQHVRLLLPWTIGLLMVLPLMLPAMQVLMIGDDPAASVGLNLERWRLASIAFAGFAATSAVAVAGPIAFVGLITPHLARLWVGGTLARQMPVTILAGALITVLADLIGRTVFAPVEIPVGAVTAAVGAPLFLYLLVRYSQ